jgi:hypothetical protein
MAYYGSVEYAIVIFIIFERYVDDHNCSPGFAPISYRCWKYAIIHAGDDG